MTRIIAILIILAAIAVGPYAREWIESYRIEDTETRQTAEAAYAMAQANMQIFTGYKALVQAGNWAILDLAHVEWKEWE